MMKTIGKQLAALLLAVLCLASAAALAAEEPVYQAAEANAPRFGDLLGCLVKAYECIV